MLMIGTNNISKDSPADIALGIKSIISEIQMRSPTTKILLHSVLNRPDLVFNSKINELNKIISAYANGTSIVYIDIASKFFAKDGSLRADLYYDHVHINTAGYQVWADNSINTVKSMLGMPSPIPAVPRAPANLHVK